MSVPQGKTFKLADLFPVAEHQIENNVIFTTENGDVRAVSLGAGAGVAMSVPQGKTFKLADLFPVAEHQIENNVIFTTENGDVRAVSLGAGADAAPRRHGRGHLALGIDGQVRIARAGKEKDAPERPAITKDDVDLAVAEGADVRRVESADDLADDEPKTVPEKDFGRLGQGMAFVTAPGQDMGISAEHRSLFVTVPLPEDVQLHGGLHLNKRAVLADLIDYRDGEVAREAVLDGTGVKLMLLALPEDVQLHGGLHLNKRAVLADLIDYRDGEVAREAVLDGTGVKLMLLAFDYEQQLAAHTAGADALFLVLEGEATVEYEGRAHTVHAGEQMVFAPDAEHAVSCERRCKVADALFLVLEGEATVEYEGRAHTVHAGEQMVFAPDAEHAVSCERRCKVALLRVE